MKLQQALAILAVAVAAMAVSSEAGTVNLKGVVINTQFLLIPVLESFGDQANINNRATLLADRLAAENFDIISLQEVFLKSAATIVTDRLQQGPYECRGTGNDDLFADGLLMCIRTTKLAFSKLYFDEYNIKASVEVVTDKGIWGTTLDVTSGSEKGLLHIGSTHMQADLFDETFENVRATQFLEVNRMMLCMMGKTPVSAFNYTAALLMGDLNVPVYASDGATSTSDPKTAEYTATMNRLGNPQDLLVDLNSDAQLTFSAGNTKTNAFSNPVNRLDYVINFEKNVVVPGSAQQTCQFDGAEFNSCDARINFVRTTNVVIADHIAVFFDFDLTVGTFDAASETCGESWTETFCPASSALAVAPAVLSLALAVLALIFLH